MYIKSINTVVKNPCANVRDVENTRLLPGSGRPS